MMNFQKNSALAIGVGLAMVWLVGCAPTTHVTETTTTREYDTKNPVVMAPVVIAPVASTNSTTTTQYDNGTVQRTYTQPAPYVSPDQSTVTTTQFNNGTVQRTYSQPAPYVAADQSTTTTVTSDADDGTTVQKKTTTTYNTP
jgi:hypothetical protein